MDGDVVWFCCLAWLYSEDPSISISIGISINIDRDAMQCAVAPVVQIQRVSSLCTPINIWKEGLRTP